MMRQQEKNSGFTLIELMIVMALIGTLIAIALPNYNSYLRRTACEDAKGVVTGAANLLERYRAQNGNYTGAVLGTYAQSPVDGAAIFNIAATTLNATTYTLTATPVANGRLAGTGTLTLTSTGVKAGTGQLANAWGRCTGL